MLSGTAESRITVFTVELQLSSHLSCTFQHEAVTVQLGCLPDEERCCQCSGVLTSTYYFSPAAAAQEVVQMSLLLWISAFINWCKKNTFTKFLYIFRGLAEVVTYVYAYQLFLPKCQVPSAKHQGAWIWVKEILIFTTQATWYRDFS